jgi:hypothetical protein
MLSRWLRGGSYAGAIDPIGPVASSCNRLTASTALMLVAPLFFRQRKFCFAYFEGANAPQPIGRVGWRSKRGDQAPLATLDRGCKGLA